MVTAFMNASIRQGYDKQTMHALSEIPEIMEIFATTGDADLRLTIAANSPEDLYRVNHLILDILGSCAPQRPWYCANFWAIAPNHCWSASPSSFTRRRA